LLFIPNDGQYGKIFLKGDIAMYKTRKNDNNKLQYFNNCMNGEMRLCSNMKRDLRNAIENEEFFLCYQPLIDIRIKKVVCMEALIRWKHPRKGIISPMEFIPIAEETGLILPIGQWVLKTACSQLKEWHDMGYNNFGLSVNVSVIQLQQPDFAETVSRIIAENRLLPEYLELEITESAFMESARTVARNLNSLRKRGIKVSIDDFGTGYNSLKYIQKLAVNSLKIDKTFVYNIKDDINKVIIDAIISLAHKINAEITAEGVETKEQYEYLKKKGCNKIQGYYFSKPLLPEEAAEFLKINSD
jgi:EAL domain-containing protein (putative c-di-GMP-specific phosphodiesterase class I)